MTVRGELCFRISKALRKAPPSQDADPERYGEWRSDEMVRTWSHFANSSVADKDVLDFGCGAGPLSIHLARTGGPRSIVGIDLHNRAIERANAMVARHTNETLACMPRFLVGEAGRIPLLDSTIDTVVALDCMEHVMDPAAIMGEWRRVLRPGGRVLIEWFPFKGPWGSHLHNLIPMPWAHIVFGERALFEAAERLYDDPGYVPRHWDFDDHGARRPNQWRGLRRFSDAGYLNQLDVRGFRRVATAAGFRIARLEAKPFEAVGSAKRAVAKALSRLPFVGEYATSFIVAELEA